MKLIQMSKKEKLGVALVKRACRVCQTTVDAEMVMNTNLTAKNAEKVEEMHGQVVGWIEGDLGMCPECAEQAKDGCFLITVDEEKTGDDVSNPWRTGRIFVIKDEAVKKAFGDRADDIIKHRACFIPDQVAQMFGLPMDYLNHNGDS